MSSIDLSKVLSECQFVLVACGAGFSADSSLPVYSDIAQIEVYKKLDLTYHDLCRPNVMLAEGDLNDKELFLGFWANCFNLYRSTTPHRGYDILKKWNNEINVPLEFKLYQQQFLKVNYNRDVHVDDVAGPMFIYTSNVDAHFHRYFEKNQIYEIHGNVEHWQCQNKNCEYCDVQKINDNHVFDVDPSNMKCCLDNFLSCKCGELMRPNVLMFGDEHYVQDEEQEQRYVAWEAAVEHFIKDNKTYGLVILEMGCGTNVPSVRMECEEVLSDTNDKSLLVRINPCDEVNLPHHAVHVQDTSLNTLERLAKQMLFNK
ncbi:cobB [Acrasis kona]|uniref:CobB n=1 Tax=Acrasis kona TaxID=1008807 RepID=A0AAW2YV33_9EUKA